MTKENETIMRIPEIHKLLPHRFPFLLVDKVLSMDAGKKIVALKNVTANESFFQGHFPDNPIMPGVLIIEALAQAAALASFSEVCQGDNCFNSCVLTGIDSARFKKVVLPGDTLILECELTKQKGQYRWFEGRAKVDDAIVASASFSAKLISEVK